MNGAQDRQVGGYRVTCYVYPSGPIHRDGVAHINARAAQISGEDQRPGTIDLGDKGIHRALERRLERIDHGKIEGAGDTRNIRVALIVECDTLAQFGERYLAARAPQITGVLQAGAIVAELRDECVLPPATMWLKGGNHGEVAGIRSAGDVSAPVGIYRDGRAAILATPTQIRAVDQLFAIRTDLGDEGVLASIIASLQSSSGKCGGCGVSGDVCITARVQRDSVAIVRAVAAQVGAEDQGIAGRVELQDERIGESG